MDNKGAYELSSAQKNIENIMFTYPEEGLCNLGGYFFINSEEEKEIAIQILSMMPVAHGALRLSYQSKGKLRVAEAEPVPVPIYECEETEPDDRERRMREWLEAPFPNRRRFADLRCFILVAESGAVVKSFTI